MPNTYSLAVAMHDLGGNFLENVFMYSLTEAGSGDPFRYADELITQWRAGVETDFLACLGNDVTVDYMSAKRVSGTGGPSATQIVVDTGSGGSTSGAAGLCADVQWQNLGINNRPGHTFIGCFPHNSYQSGFFDPAYQTVVGTWISTMLGVLTLGGGFGTATFGILQRKGKVFNVAKSGKLMPKPTMLNKRSVPLL